MTATRELLATQVDTAVRRRVYAADDGLDIDETEQMYIRRVRVLWDEVQLVTLSRQREVTRLVVWGLLTLFLGLGIVKAFLPDWSAVAAASFGTWVPAGVYLALRARFGISVVAVYGRRTRVLLRFPFRPGRAASVYRQICGRVRAAQGAPLGTSEDPGLDD